MLKHIQGWNLTKAVNSEYKLFVPSFKRVKTMFLLCFCENNPGQVIIQVGTNDQCVCKFLFGKDV